MLINISILEGEPSGIDTVLLLGIVIPWFSVSAWLVRWMWSCEQRQKQLPDCSKAEECHSSTQPHTQPKFHTVALLRPFNGPQCATLRQRVHAYARVCVCDVILEICLPVKKKKKKEKAQMCKESGAARGRVSQLKLLLRGRDLKYSGMCDQQTYYSRGPKFTAPYLQHSKCSLL